jgi:putative NIF3 family GTP cyclohydrolase 1 type 2
MQRREFIAWTSAVIAGALAPATGSSAENPEDAMTVQEVIDLLIGAAGRQGIPDTVDTIKTGDSARALAGVVTTFMANVGVIEQAIALGANLIVTHEPTFYNHRDETDWLADDPVYRAKRKLLDDHGIVTFRYHDFIHSITPDPVIQATSDQLGWTAGAVPEAPAVYRVPPSHLEELVADVKQRLGLPNVRVVGDPKQVCRRVGLLVGAPGGRRQIGFLSLNQVDAVVVGEIAEWETSEYVRDANRVGRPLALIVVGHSASEALGMKWLAGWLKPRLPVPVDYVAAPSPFAYE